MEKVIAQLSLDHLRLKRIIKSLAQQVEYYLRDETQAAPDLNIIKAMVEYTTIRGDQYHHALEEMLLLKLETQITDNELLQLFATIRRQHSELDEQAKIILGYFTAIDAGNEVPISKIITAYSRYASTHLEHLETEDTYFYPMIDQLFSNNELKAIQNRFGISDDPVFGPKPEKPFKHLHNFVLSYES